MRACRDGRSRLVLCLALIGSLTAGVPAVDGQEPSPFEEVQETRTTSTTVGYIDSALPRNTFRFRYSAGFQDNRPDRAEFFYPKYQQYTGFPGNSIYVNNPPSGGGPGPPLPEKSVDFQDVAAYLEWAACDQFSIFVETPVRFLNPDINQNTSGMGDMNAGFKWAFVYTPEFVATFQLRTYIPTGASTRGLGTNHVTLEPSFLFNYRLTDLITLEAQFGDWVPVNGTDFAGNVLLYGVGASYLAYDGCHVQIAPVVELMGWTVLSGKETAFVGTSQGVNVFQIQDAAGDSILNVKVGVRARFRCSDFYVGYGRALTGDVWYKDIVRAEYRFFF